MLAISRLAALAIVPSTPIADHFWELPKSLPKASYRRPTGLLPKAAFWMLSVICDCAMMMSMSYENSACLLQTAPLAAALSARQCHSSHPRDQQVTITGGLYQCGGSYGRN